MWMKGTRVPRMRCTGLWEEESHELNYKNDILFQRHPSVIIFRTVKTFFVLKTERVIMQLNAQIFPTSNIQDTKDSITRFIQYFFFFWTGYISVRHVLEYYPCIKHTRASSHQVFNAEHSTKPEVPRGELPLEFYTFVFVTSVHIPFIPYFGSHASL